MKTNVRKIKIKPGEVIHVIHSQTGTVISVALNLTDEFACIKHESNPDGLGLDWSRSAERFIDLLLNQEVPS